VCEHKAVPDGDTEVQTPGDCHVRRCKGGVVEEALDAADNDDNNDCTVDACDDSGAPTHTAAPAGTSRSGGPQTGLCDAFGQCQIECGAGLPACDDNNPCTTDLCDLTVSQCSFAPVPDGTPTPGVPQITGDCRVRQCIAGVDANVVDDTDLP